MPRTTRVWLAALAAATLLGCGSGGAGAGAVTGEHAPPPRTTPSVAGPTPAAPIDQAPTERAQLASGATVGECADDGTAARAVRAVLAHAERQGIAHAQLADCRFDAARCGAERTQPAEEADGARCVVDVRPTDGIFQIEVRPRALAGAPRWIDASVDANAPDPPARFYVGASTWAVGRRPSLVVGGVDGHISHAHGGEPARIDHAELSIRNGSTTALRVAARRVEWLTAASCDVPSEVRALPAVAGLSAGGGGSPGPEVSVAPGASGVTVWFAPQAAYYAYCDRFAARVTLDVGGETIVAVAEWEVASRARPRTDAP